MFLKVPASQIKSAAYELMSETAALILKLENYPVEWFVSYGSVCTGYNSISF